MDTVLTLELFFQGKKPLGTKFPMSSPVLFHGSPPGVFQNCAQSNEGIRLRAGVTLKDSCIRERRLLSLNFKTWFSLATQAQVEVQTNSMEMTHGKRKSMPETRSSHN